MQGLRKSFRNPQAGRNGDNRPMLEIVLSATCGAVAALVAFIALRSIGSLRKRPQLRTAIMVAAVVISLQLVRPYLRSWIHENDVNRLLRTDRLLKRVTRDDPSLHEPLRQALLEGYTLGGDTQAIAAARDLLIPVLPKYLGKGSDETVLRFVRQTVSTLRTMGAAPDPNRCFHYLFPKAGAAVKPTVEEGRDELRAALVAVVESEGPPPEAEAVQAQTLLHQVLDSLSRTRGGDLSILRQTKDPAVDRRKLCAITADIYSEALKLPPAQSAVLLRFLFAQ